MNFPFALFAACSKIVTALASIAILVWYVEPGFAITPLETSQLEKLDPLTRLEQRCDVEAMERISGEQKRFFVDKVIAYAFSDPVMTGTIIKADGAAFRSGEHWYRLSFSCKTDEKRINILSFEYKIGPEVPKRNWAQHYLVP